MKKLLLIFCSAFLMLNTNAQILDQSCTGSVGSGWLVNNGSYTSQGQSFTAGLTGFLSSITINIEAGNSTYPIIAGNFTLTVRSGNGHAGAILGIDTFSITGSEPSGDYNIPIKPNTISITAGNSYTYIIHEISSTGQLMLNATANNYAGGVLYWQVFTNPPNIDTNRDYLFKTYVQGCVNSSSTITASVCNSNYTSPSGKIFTTSNTYMDTIPNAASCDSIITINLTVNNIIDQTVTAAQNAICGSGSTTINTASSDNGVNYYLRNDLNDTIVDGPITGTGSGLAFNTGTINTTTTYNVYGKITGPTGVGALEFTGNSGLKSVSLGTTIWNTHFAGNTQLTVEAWIKRSSLGSLHTIMSNYTGAFPFIFRIDNDNIKLFVNSGANATGATTLPTGVWTHVAGTYDGTDIKVYVNGILDGTTAYNIPLIGSTNDVRIGGGIANNTEYFIGDIADVRMWNVSKTQPQIAADKDIILVGTETGLVANYQFTEGTGSTTANAATGNLYPGTLINNPNWVNGPMLNDVTCDLEMTNTPTVVINQASSATISPTACKSYTSPSGKIFTTSNTYMDTIPNAASCDSIITINLTVNTVDVSVTSASPMFTANATSATYQWVDCNNSFAAISGETNASFTATANGDYAVIVTQNGCTDTSACINVTGVGIDEITFNSISVYPNPTTGITTINLGNNNIAVNYIITTIDGRVIDQQQNITTNQINIDLTNQSNGVYFIKLFNRNSNTNIKLIKN